MAAPHNIGLQRTASRRLAAAELGSLAIHKGGGGWWVIMCGVALAATQAASATQPCRCTGEAEALAEIPGGAKPAVVACGYRESQPGVSPVVASEIAIFRCGEDKSLVALDASATCTLSVVENRLVITRSEKWPFGAAWKWVDVAVRRYVIAGDGQIETTLVLKPPALTQRQVGDALDYYARHIHRAGLEEEYEDVIGRVLAAAVAGDVTARQALSEMPTTLNLDGHSAEIYQEAITLYNSSVPVKLQLPRLEDP